MSVLVLLLLRAAGPHFAPASGIGRPTHRLQWHAGSIAKALTGAHSSEVWCRPGNHPALESDRFRMLPLPPSQIREVVERLLQIPALAEQVPWLSDKTADGVAKEISHLQLQCQLGTVMPWGIVERSSCLCIGAVLVTHGDTAAYIDILWTACVHSGADAGDEIEAAVLDWLQVAP